MYIVAIAWIYVVMMVSFLQPSIFRGLTTFIGAGILPLALILFLVGTPQRRRNKVAVVKNQDQSKSELLDDPQTAEGTEPKPVGNTGDVSKTV